MTGIKTLPVGNFPRKKQKRKPLYFLQEGCRGRDNLTVNVALNIASHNEVERLQAVPTGWLVH